MKCSYCYKEIEDDENFYIYENKIYCNKCCEEETRTYYTIGGDPETYTEDGVEEFTDKEEAIEDLERELNSITATIKGMENSKQDYIKFYLAKQEKNKAKIEKMLKVLKGNGEED